MRKQIALNSPPGSGNVFFQHLVQRNLNVDIKWSNHNLLGFEKNQDNIFLLRDPYDVIASGIEIRFINTANEEDQNKFFDDVDFRIQDKIIRHHSEYNRFMNMAKWFSDEITTVTFDLLTKNPDKLLEFISKKFEVSFNESRHSAERVKKQIQDNKDISTRVPREKSDFRKKIDLAVRDHAPLENTFKEYILFRDKIQSTENMV
jgi:hypothetical protein